MKGGELALLSCLRDGDSEQVMATLQFPARLLLLLWHLL